MKPDSYEMAYKTLVGLVMHEEDLFWKRNDFVLVINGAMLSILGLLIAPDSTINSRIKLISVFMCIMGFVINTLWFLVAKRSEAFYNHWFEQLIDIETQYLPSLKIFRTANDFFANGEIKLGKKQFTLDPLSKAIKMFTTVLILTVIFVLIWIVLFFGILVWK